MSITQFPVHDVEQACLKLNPRRNLQPNTPEFEALYVPRPDVEQTVIRRMLGFFVQAAQDRTYKQWFLTGHTGCGKSTELKRLLLEEQINQHYHCINIDLLAEFDINNMDFAEIILTITQKCIELAKSNRCPIPDTMLEQIKQWDQEIFTEKERVFRTEGRAAIQVKLPFFFAKEEIRSGGSNREVIRERVKRDLTTFIYWTNITTKLISEKINKEILCVLDGMDHMDVNKTKEMLLTHNEILRQLNISQLLVIPIPLLNTQFGVVINQNYSCLPNLKVYKGVDERFGVLSEEGLKFFTTLIEKHCDLALFEEGVLPCLFELSGGDVRDMIRAANEACNATLSDQVDRVGPKQAIAAWYQTRQFFRWQLTGDDYKILRQVNNDPYLEEGNQEIAPLLHKKAILFFANGEGWYSVHPAVKQMMDKKQPCCPRP